jgi:DNA modification methylase
VRQNGERQLPTNVIEESLVVGRHVEVRNNAANDAYTLRCKEEGIKIHPLRFPSALPAFFIRMLTEPGDVVLDFFAGSKTTGATAEKLKCLWLAIELSEEYLRANKFRFQD